MKNEKKNNLGEKMENKLKDTVKLTIVLWLLPWKDFFLVMVNFFFPQSIKEDRRHY